MALADALAKLEDGDRAGCLSALIDAWKQRPLVAVGDLCADLDVDGPALSDGQWLQTAVEPGDSIGWLARTLRAKSRSASVPRFEAAAQWPRDPRVGPAVAALIESVPWTASESQPAWEALFRLAVAVDDPRMAVLEPAFAVRPAMKEWLSGTWASLDRGPAPPAPTAEEQATIAAMRALLAPSAKDAAKAQTVEALLDAVYAAPTDDGPRLVLADVLMERGDPRGEFIAAQCAGTRAKKPDDAWIGPIHPVIRKKGLAFRRGFPSAARLYFRHDKDIAEHGSHAAWATLEDVTWTLDGKICVPPTLKAIRVARGLWDPGVGQLARLHLPHLEELYAKVDTIETVEALEGCEGWPALRTLSLRGLFSQPSRLGWLWNTPLRLDTLIVAKGTPFSEANRLGHFLAAVQGRGLSCLKVRNRVDFQSGDPQGLEFEVRAGPDGELTELTVRAHSYFNANYYARELAKEVEGLPLTSLTLEPSKHWEPPEIALPSGSLPAAKGRFRGGYVGPVAVAPDGRLAVGNAGDVVLVDEGVRLRGDRVPGIAWSPDGTKIATSGRRRVIWDVATRTRERVEDERATSVVWTDAGLAWVDNTQVHVEGVKTWKSHKSSVYGLAFRGTRLLTWSLDEVKIFDVAAPTKRGTVVRPGAFRAAWLDDDHIVVSRRQGEISVCDLPGKQLSATRKIGVAEAQVAVFGDAILVLGTDPRVVTRDLVDIAALDLEGARANARHVAVGEDRIYLCQDGVVHVLNPQTWTFEDPIV